MKLNQLFVPALAVLAGSYLIPSDSEGFVLLGHSLSLSQRDVRVFNNFTDTAANNNTVAHYNFPGYDGAEMALWKACIEWGSRLHGDGQGDTTQNFGLGSGGANFDLSWQGNATGVGNTNANTMSELSGSNGGVLAFAEGPFSDGWRVRFFSGWLWADGPGSTNGAQDLQGIGCHEYGHCLGMGHSSVNGATMTGFASGNGTSDRSIAADDIAGIQAVYGVASASKPTIDDTNLCSGELEITGSNFSATSNEVWFTQAGTGGSGTPVKVFGVKANGAGDTIIVTVPASAGPGDVLVKNSGNSHANLSNAWPFDPAVEGTCVDPPAPITTFCVGDGGLSPGCTDCACGNNNMSGQGGCLNSASQAAVLVGSGNPQISDDTLQFDVFAATPNNFAILQSGSDMLPNNPANPCPPGSGIQTIAFDGLRCIGGATLRHGVRPTDSSGFGTSPWGGSGAPAFGLAIQAGFVAGETRHWQVIYREILTVNCGTGLNTTNAASMTWAP